MGKLIDFATKLFAEKRGGVSDPNHWIVKLTERIGAKSGVWVDERTALSLSAVFACVRVISETVASLPLMIYRRRTDGGKEPAEDHFLYKLMHDQPNPYQTSFEFREMLTGHTALRGNAYAFIEKTRRGVITQLIPLHPARMIPKKEGEKIIYEYTHEDGKQEVYPAELIWHWRGMSSDGIVGLSPLKLHAEAFGLAKAAEEHGALFYRNGAKMSGIAKLPGRLKESSKSHLQESLNKAVSGDNKFRIIVFEEGMDWVNVSMNNDDAQFIETRGFQIEEIARIFRVPCVLIGHADKTATYASAEQFFLSFVTHTIRPWLVRIEQTINSKLMPEGDRGTYFAEHKLDGILRGDILSRYQAYSIARMNKWMSVNEIRALENMNPVEGGDEYENPNITVDYTGQNEGVK